MRIARLPIFQRVDLLLGVVKRWMDGEIRIGAGLCGDLLESRGGCAPDFEGLFHRSEISDPITHHAGIDAAPDGADVPSVSILERNQQRDGSWRVARREI